MEGKENNVGFGRIVPPQLEHVEMYFIASGSSALEAGLFFKDYEQRKWLNRQGKILKNWKERAWEWLLKR